ncbi:ParB N-terminal domain-containing protein [Streptomyces sp. NPDC059477]|uniref:ParB N-terminal domain-containing protein n=1 Tax=Streptomyces sp. NPDC059477 TaxID=3346847 RepID=UPI00367A5077
MIQQMPTRMLTDGVISPTEYRKWAHARTRFETRPKDAALLAQLLESIPVDGLREPITIGVDDRYHDVYVTDGHHRAIAVTILDLPEFPFRWHWITSWGAVRMETRPFPYHLLDD